jgi:hypothetical protein
VEGRWCSQVERDDPGQTMDDPGQDDPDDPDDPGQDDPGQTKQFPTRFTSGRTGYVNFF